MNVDSAGCDFQRDKTPRGVAARFGEGTKTHDLFRGEETLHHHSLFKVTSTVCIVLTHLAGGKIHRKKDLFICHGCHLVA